MDTHLPHAARVGPAEPRSAGGSAPDEGRVRSELENALADHLLEGRVTSDVGQGLAAALTAFVFWDHAAPTAAIGWLLAVFVSVLARLVHRRSVIAALPHPEARLRRLRVDVWTSAALWGFGGPLLISATDVDLAMLLLVYAGLIAAATSTVVADRRAFYGFAGLILVPMSVSVLAGGLTRDQLSLLLLTLLFAPFMLIVHERAHRVLVGQLTSQARLRISEEVAAGRSSFLRSVLNAAPNPIVVLGPDDRILALNPAFTRVTGHPDASSIGIPVATLIESADGHDQLASFLDSVAKEERAVVELRVRRADGELIWMRLTGTTSSRAGMGAAVLIGEDVTAEVAIREAREAARIAAEESTRAKSRFLASMSHEIRTPMNGVMGMIELLGDTPLDEQQRDWLAVLHSSADSLLTILNDILDVSKIEAGQLTLEQIDFDLSKTVSESFRAFSHRAGSKGIELVLDVARDVPRTVEGDPVRLRQVLTNLLSNALKFTEEGEVTLELSSEPVGDHAALLRFTVRDTGIGIPEDKRETIFDEFSQADASTTRTHGGTGLGLAICRKLVALMNGTLTVDSEVGSGSAFSFTLPMRVSETPVAARRLAAPSLAGRRFLVIDDNAAARSVVRGLVVGEGGLLEEADAARTGIDLIERRMGTNDAYDVVVLDSVMPGEDGFAVAEAVRAMPEPRRPRLLMLTSAAAGNEAERARALGVRGFLEKPVSRSRLLQAISILVGPERSDGPERRLLTAATLEQLPCAGRILVVDDSTVNQHVARALLEKRGYHVDVVGNGREAVDVALGGAFDLVLMDVEMPGMDGLDATRQIRKHRDRDALPIVALTAHAATEEADRCRDAGMNDFLPKPFRAHRLYEVIERWSGDGKRPIIEQGDRGDGPPRVPRGGPR